MGYDPCMSLFISEIPKPIVMVSFPLPLDPIALQERDHQQLLLAQQHAEKRKQISLIRDHELAKMREEKKKQEEESARRELEQLKERLDREEKQRKKLHVIEYVNKNSKEEQENDNE